MNEQLVAKLKELALKNGKAFALELIVEVAIPALEQAVAKSETKIDDAVVIALKEPLKMALIELVNNIDAK